MLLLIINVCINIVVSFFYLNTSNVTVNLKWFITLLHSVVDLNTSNVTVNLIHLSINISYQHHLNTSNVTVNHGGLFYELYNMKFKYI